MKKLTIKEENLGDLSYWNILFKTLENDFKKLKKQTKRDILGNAYKKAPDSVRLNKEWVMKAVIDYYISFYHVDEQIKDKEYCLSYIEKYEYPSIYSLPEQYHEELFEICVLKYENNIHDLWHNKNLSHLRTKENFCKWVAKNPNIYKELEKTSYVNDFAIAEIAVKADPTMLLKMNRSIARKVISRNLNLALDFFEKEKKIFPMLPLKIRNDEDFILKYVSKLDYENVAYIGKEALIHREVLLQMKTFYDVIIPEKHLTDREVVYHIISRQNFIHEDLKDCENFTIVELIKELLLNKKSTSFYKNLPDSYKVNPEVISAFLEIGYFPEARKIKTISAYGYEYEETKYIDTSVVKLLSEEIKEQLNKELKDFTGNLGQHEESELLSFARNKYLQMNLVKKFDEKVKVKRLKI